MLSGLTADMQHTSKDDKWQGLNQARPGKATAKKKTLRKPSSLHQADPSSKFTAECIC